MTAEVLKEPGCVTRAENVVIMRLQLLFSGVGEYYTYA